MFWSLVYAVVCRLLEFAVLLARGERSKELEIIVLLVRPPSQYTPEC